MALERAEERGIFDLGPVLDLLERSGGHRGRRPLRRALAIYADRAEDPAVLRSHLEKRFLRLVRRAGLPRPATNFAAHSFELDVYWPSCASRSSSTSSRRMGSRAAFERDRRRQEELKLAGIEMVRITGTRLGREPTATVSRVAELLAQRARDLA